MKKNVCVCCLYVVTKSCPTLCDPMGCSLPGSSVHRILQARVLEWVATSYSRGSSRPRDRNSVSCVPCIGRHILIHSTTRKVQLLLFLSCKLLSHVCVFLTWLTRRRQWHPTPVLLPGKSHGQRSLVGCSPWDRKESDTAERLHFHFSLSCTGEGNGNPLQYSCLENPRDGGAWWAAVYGVTQSWT